MQQAARLNEVVTPAEVKSEIMILDATKNGLRHCADIKLLITAGPAVTSHHAPTNASRHKESADFIIARWIYDTEQIAGFERELELLRVEFISRRGAARYWHAGERLRARAEKRESTKGGEHFHSRISSGGLRPSQTFPLDNSDGHRLPPQNSARSTGSAL